MKHEHAYGSIPVLTIIWSAKRAQTDLQGALTQNLEGEITSEIILSRDIHNTHEITRVNIA